MTANYAVVIDGVILNVVVLDDPAAWTPPEGASVHALDPGQPCDIGWAWADGAPVDPNPPPVTPPPGA